MLHLRNYVCLTISVGYYVDYYVDYGVDYMC